MYYFFGERGKLSAVSVKIWPAYRSLKVEGKCRTVRFLLLITKKIKVRIQIEAPENRMLGRKFDPGVAVIYFCYLFKDFVRLYGAVNPLKTKHRILYIQFQFVPRSKHFSSRL